MRKAVIQKVRSGELAVPEGSAADVIARHHEADGRLLDEKVAALELLNLLHPIVAIARFATFAALALHTHPDHKLMLQTSDDDYPELFVQEVRRFYPYFPFIGGRAG